MSRWELQIHKTFLLPATQQEMFSSDTALSFNAKAHSKRGAQWSSKMLNKTSYMTICAVYFKSRDIVIWNWACSQIWLKLHFYKLKQLIDTFDMNIKACTTYLVSMLNIYLHWIEKISVKWTLFKTSFVLHIKSHRSGLTWGWVNHFG